MRLPGAVSQDGDRNEETLCADVRYPLRAYGDRLETAAPTLTGLAAAARESARTWSGRRGEITHRGHRKRITCANLDFHGWQF